MSARVVQPIVFDMATHLVSSTATEIYAAYSAITSYAMAARVISGDIIYESLSAGNLGNAPASSPLAWLPLGSSNRYAMFDGQINSVTMAPTTLTVVMAPGPINSIGLFGLVGQVVEVTVRNGAGGPIVYGNASLSGPHVISLDATLITDWYQYYFEPSVRMGELVLMNIPPFYNAHITVTVSAQTGNVGIGLLTLGVAYTLGEPQYGAKIGITDYSRKDTDEFGVSTFTKRAYSKTMSLNIMLPNAQMNKVQKVLASLRATPCAWIGSGNADFSSLVIFGYFKDFSIDIAYLNQSLCTLEIEGLI